VYREGETLPTPQPPPHRNGEGEQYSQWTVGRERIEGTSAAGVPALRKVEWLTDGERARRVRLTFACAADERFFGLGERFNALDQRGNVMDIRCYEQYKNQGKRTYMPIPFLLSSAGYGVLVESNRWMQFDLAATTQDTWTLEADVGADETLCLEWFTGDDPMAIIGAYSQMTGPPALPPEWAFGLWMSANEWNTQARVEEEVRLSLEHGIQPSVVVIEAWSDETTFYTWNDAQYTPRAGDAAPRLSDFTFPPDGKWTDPKGMTDWLHSNDIRLLLWQIPVLKAQEQPHTQHEIDRAYYEAAGYGVREADGSAHKVRPFWFRNGYLWDVTNPQERDWWLDKRAYLLDEIGIDGFKTDGGEHLWGSDTRFADGRRGDELWNEYPQLYTEAYYQRAQARGGITFSRAGYTGSQRAPLHWAGDENSTWDAYRHSILAGLSAGISGIAFWGWDFGGFSGPIPTAELYLRGAAIAAFCPVMQYHSEYNPHRQYKEDRSPWNMQARTGDARILPLFRKFLDARQRIMPYILREAQHSADTGEPMMRALQLWHAEAREYQYLFGRDLLVCPVVQPDVSRWQVYLPPGTWRDFWTDEIVQGGGVIDVEAGVDTIPAWWRGS
jgi:alpha-glucosidase (family GH31 glycosyl hydrolase)